MTLTAIAIAAFAITAQSQQNDAATIRALSDQWQKDVAAQNVDAIVALHAPDAVVMFSHAPLVKGSAAIRGVWGDAVKTPGLVMHWTPTKIEVASPTVATEYGTYTESYDTPDGKGTDAGNYVTIWHKINGKWRVALDAPNTTTPLPAAAAVPPDVKTIANSALTWSDFMPTGFDPGMKLAVLEGDPAAKGPYVLRLMFPAGYRFPVHWHPGIENLTVVSGNFLLGMGNTADANGLKTYAPGDFLYIPPRHAHWGGSTAGAASVIQLHGEGPFQLMLGAPK
jgi:ketosteroid isomerase-like protein/quercetin dioxygenase-like cupin family protein